MRGKLVALATVAGALFTVAGIAYATIPDAQGVIHGCRGKRVGNVRVIDPASQSCLPSEIALDWNQQGAKGDKGDKGEKGDPGGILAVYINRDTDVLPAGAVRGYRAQCGVGDQAIGGGFDSDSPDVTAFGSDVDVVNPAYVLRLNNKGSTAATIQFTAYCADLTP